MWISFALAVGFGPVLCGWVCPLGSIQEFFSKLGKKVFKTKFNSLTSASMNVNRPSGLNPEGLLNSINGQSQQSYDYAGLQSKYGYLAARQYLLVQKARLVGLFPQIAK